MTNLNLRHLEAFVRVAAVGNFTRAAQSLHISQPALTVQIRQLEEIMGVRLVDRNTRTVRLTKIGQELAPMVQRLLHELEIAVTHAHEMAAGVRGVVSIAALPSTCAVLLPRIIAAYRKDHPGITISVRDVVAQKVVAMVRNDEVDFGIGSFGDLGSAFEITPLFTDRLRVVFPATLPLARKRKIDLKDLVDYPLILMDSQSSVRMTVDRAFDSIGHLATPAYQARYMSSAVGMAKAGLGVAFLPTSTLEVSELTGLTSRVVDHPSLTRNIVAIRKTSRPLSLAAGNFLNVVVGECRAVRNNRRPAAKRK